MKKILNRNTQSMEKAKKSQCPRCKGFGANHGDVAGCGLCNGYGTLWLAISGWTLPLWGKIGRELLY